MLRRFASLEPRRSEISILSSVVAAKNRNGVFQALCMGGNANGDPDPLG
jgi:hypothetical protein